MAKRTITGGGSFTYKNISDINSNFTELYGGGTGTQGVATLANNVTAVESGNGGFHTTVLTLTAVPMAVSDSNVGGGVKIYTFPQGIISLSGATASVAETTTSAIASTLNSGVTLSAGVGSVITTTQASGTLVTTQQDIVNAFAPVSSTTINVAAAAATGFTSATTSLKFDGHTTAQAVFLNCGVPTATDIDADATTTWTGTVTLVWQYLGTF